MAAALFLGPDLETSLDYSLGKALVVQLWKGENRECCSTLEGRREEEKMEKVKRNPTNEEVKSSHVYLHILQDITICNVWNFTDLKRVN